jgi:hypothetical protein
LLPILRASGCLFITSAVESVDDSVLQYLDKHHSRADVGRALMLCRANGISLAPTFVPFTPWTTLDGYLDLLRDLVQWELQQALPAVQLTIRLLVPQGSYLLRLPGFATSCCPSIPGSSVIHGGTRTRGSTHSSRTYRRWCSKWKMPRNRMLAPFGARASGRRQTRPGHR